jgi:hypothetical protein
MFGETMNKTQESGWSYMKPRFESVLERYVGASLKTLAQRVR